MASWIHRRSRATRVVHTLILAVAVLFFAYRCPTPYFLSSPGPIFEASRLVHVEGAQAFSGRGSLLLPTAVFQPANLLFTIYALLDPSAELSRPQAADGQEDGDFQMTLSQNLAIEAALDRLAKEMPGQVRGLRVLGVAPGTPNSQALRVGDILLGLEQRPLGRTGVFSQFLDGQPPGQRLRAQVDRQGQVLSVPVVVLQAGPRHVLGLRLQPALRRSGRELSVHIETHDVSGASGGLLFCLEILRQLANQDPTRGHRVAVTGTLDRGGRVGPVEGVRFKKLAAQKAGAELFVCPGPNRQEAESVGGIPVVAVDTLEEALQTLSFRNF